MTSPPPPFSFDRLCLRFLSPSIIYALAPASSPSIIYASSSFSFLALLLISSYLLLCQHKL
ncbi:hypothetical protein GBA52_003526, partial [Prunus armeniaca]